VPDLIVSFRSLSSATITFKNLLFSPCNPPYVAASHGLLQVIVPTGSARRAGLTTDKYQKRPPREYAEQDAKNGCPQVSLWPNNGVSIMTETQRPYS